MVIFRLNQKQLVGLSLFAISFLYVYWIAGDILRIGGDEGIYLEGGRLVALGQQPHRDFFAITGPLTFWIEGVLARWGGMSLVVMRLPLIFDAAFLAWAVYWFTSRYTSAIYAAGTAISFLGCEARLRQLNVNHRWDSGALAIGAVLLASLAQRTRRRILWAASGFLIVAAACATPSMLLVLLPLLFWSGRRGLREALALLGGAAVAAGMASGYLQYEHALIPTIRSMWWTSANYSQANHVFYGGLFLRALPGAAPIGWIGIVTLPFSLIPAILPLAAILGWMLYLRRQHEVVEPTEIVPLLMVATALVFSAWPRWTSDALLHTMALSWFLCALLFYRIAGANTRRWVGLMVLLAFAGSLTSKAIAAMDYVPRDTRVGLLRAVDDESDSLADLEHAIQPGDSVFCFPYLPAAYYFLQARNPTRYSFLQPGMMTLDDEERVIEELAAAPPRWVIYEKVPPEAILAAWPGSDPARIPMTLLNDYLHQHYHAIDNSNGAHGHLAIMEINPAVPLL